MSRIKLLIRLAVASVALVAALSFMTLRRNASGSTSSLPEKFNLSSQIVSAAGLDDGGPKAHDDFDSTQQGVPVQTEVTANDEISNFNITLTVHNQPSHGSAVPLDKKIITYTPEPNFHGEDSYRYQVCSNKGGDGDGGGCSEADVTITVHPADDPPTTEGPALSWLSPVGDEEVYHANGEMVVLEIQASDAEGVASVAFHRWDVPAQEYVELATLTNAPYRFDLDTGTLNVGWNQINARAYDNAGHASEVRHIWVLKTTQIFLPLTAR